MAPGNTSSGYQQSPQPPMWFIIPCGANDECLSLPLLSEMAWTLQSWPNVFHWLNRVWYSLLLKNLILMIIHFCRIKLFIHFRLTVAWWRHMATWIWKIIGPIMACCLATPRYYLRQCWLIINKVPWHSSEGIMVIRCCDNNQLTKIKIASLKSNPEAPFTNMV